MIKICRSPLFACGLAAMLSACAGTAVRPSADSATAGAAAMFQAERVTEHRGQDDLLTAGLGLAGLQSQTAPAFADAARPTAAEARRRAIWSNWRGIADLAPGGGYGSVYGSVQAVPGREFSAYATVPGARHPHRVLVQLPDQFDRQRRCVVVAAASGSRGVYGGIAVAAPWALPKGCAVVYTDKGAGSDYVDLASGDGVQADGTRAALTSAGIAFVPDAASGAAGMAFKHAHSQDNPEADWGRHVKQAAEYALQVLNQAWPDDRYTFDNTRIIAVGISNGGGAVLRAAELDGDWLDAVVAGEPNIYLPGDGARALYDYASQAALLQPCALLHLPADALAQPPLRAQIEAAGAARCASLKAAGLVEGTDQAAQARSAYVQLRDTGWTDDAMAAGAASTGFDLWRAVLATYASAYGRYRVGEHPCGQAYIGLNPDFSPRGFTDAERAAWWSEGSGIPPGNGIVLTERAPAPPDLTFAGLQCLRDQWTGTDPAAQRVQAGISDTHATLPRADLPIIVVHGEDDGLIPLAFTSAPYVRQAQAAGRRVRFWRVAHAEHFDAFLGFPDYATRYVPMLPYIYAALDRALAHIEQKAPLPADARIQPTLRAAGQGLQAGDLAIPMR